MSKALQSEQTKLVVVPHDPGRGRRYFLIGLLLALASFAVGYFISNNDYFSIETELVGLREELTESRQNATSYQRQLAKYEVASNVDQEASNNARESMAGMRQEIADLKSEISFYKGLMDPADGDDGIGIHDLELTATSEPRKFQFKMVLQQRSSEHSIVSGYVNVNVVGSKDGFDLTLPISDLSDDIKGASIEYRFKYFQNIEGSIVLPEDYQPIRLDVIVIGSGASPVYLEKKFDWQAKEA